jgi:hypothetical protein
MEEWSGGAGEPWSDGVMEYWSIVGEPWLGPGATG